MPVSDYEVVIGLEVHCQLATRSKMFSTCPYRIGAPPNACVDPYTMGMPGTLPVPNRRAVDFALRLALALGCEIQARSWWARKHYFYPDLPKGYQITQASRPYALGGAVEIPDPSGEGPLPTKTIRLERIHMEEDAGKNIHGTEDGLSLLDFNRAGAPLVEIVTLPVLDSASDAAAYMRELRDMVRYLGISEANMEEGTMRCDANVSLREPGETALGTRCEIKNLNSFKFLEAAISAEIRRQADVLDQGGTIVQSTLSYDTARDQTKVMRTKEAAADYRYLPEPDIPPLDIDAPWIEQTRASLPALPWVRRRALVGLGLSAYDAGVLTAERELVDYFSAALDVAGEPAMAKPLCNWITGELLKHLNAANLDIADCPVSPASMAEITARVADETISRRAAKEVLTKCFESGMAPAQIIERDGYRQVSDAIAIEALVRRVFADNPDQVALWVGGKAKVRGFFVGQVMRETRGQANPKVVQAALAKVLAELSPDDKTPEK